jgi:PAS domain S-box-containing protein
MAFGCLTIPWTKHLVSGRVLIRRAFDIANAMGDVTYAVYSFKNLITSFLISGEPLPKIQQEAEQALDFARKARFGLYVDTFIGQLMLIHDLRGLKPDVFRPEGTEHDDRWFERHLEEGRTRLALAASWYWIHRMQARFFAQDYAAGIEAASKADNLLWATRSHLEIAEYHFYGALTRAAVCDSVPSNQRPQHIEALLSHYEQIAVWAQNCPENFGNRAALVGAEIARLEGRELDAMRLYEEAIRLTREHGFIQNEGLAHELAARFYAARGFESIAHTYLRNARYCYLRWGADGKIRQLEQLYPQLREEPALPSPTATVGVPIEQLDAVTVVRASQAVSGEIVLGRLIEILMTIALEHAGAGRGLLILLRGDELRIEAEARTGRQKVEVTLRRAAVTSAALPESVLHTVIRTRQSVILDDARRSNPFPEDDYLRQRGPRSVLCFPLVKQAELIGLLYLENNLTPGTFTPQRIAVLELLASQAAISLENARLYEELRRSEAFLAEGQKLSQTGSWGWKNSSRELTWSSEHFHILGFEADKTRPTLEIFWDRVHPEDRPGLEQAFDRTIREKSDFDKEFRVVLPDGSVRHLHGVGHAVINESDEFIGTTADVTERKRAEEALRNAQAELARATRLTTVGELAASIAHEINQPLAAIAINAGAGLRWLNRDQPDLDEARDAILRVARDGKRARDVIRGLRALVKRSGPERARLDINEAIQEVLALTRNERQRHEVVLHTDMFTGDWPVFGDRVQLQQVMLNLIMNGLEAMNAVTDRPRVLAISTQPAAQGGVVVAVEDTGPGVDPTTADRIFDPFFTTKPNGMGMGLSICRSIIEAHGGQLWASPRMPHGTAFCFTVPAAAESPADMQPGLKPQTALGS